MAKGRKKYYLYELDVLKLNIISIVVFLVAILSSFIFYQGSLSIELNNLNIFLFLLMYIGWCILHEIIHSIAYVINGASYKKIVYGAFLEKGVFYCLCKQNVSKKNILNSLMYPLFFIGIVTFVIAIIFKLPLLLLLSVSNMAGSVGDILMFMFIVKLNKNIEFSELDNPLQFAIYSDEDLSNKKPFGLKYIEKQDTIARDYLQKIVISKASWIAILIMVAAAILFSFI